MLRIVLALALLLSTPALAETPTEAVSRLNAEVARLYGQGEYREAEAIARQAFETAERNFGPEAPDTLTPLNNLALLYERQGRYGEAEPLHKTVARGRTTRPIVPAMRR